MTDQANTERNRQEANGQEVPIGEAEGADRTFSAAEIANAFEVDVERVYRAFSGEYGLQPEGRVDSAQAQDLAELILTDMPMDKQMAALMTLGAYTPRADAVEATATEKAPGELSDRLRPTEDVSELSAPPEPKR